MRAGVVLLLLLGIAHAKPEGSVEGRVLDADGDAVPWAIVTAHCVTTERPLAQSARADEDGFFRIENLPPGVYVLEVGEPKAPAWDGLASGARAQVEHAVRVLYAKEHPRRVSVGPGVSVRLDVRRPRKVPVTVLLERDGKPLADAMVALRALDKEGVPRLTDPFDFDMSRPADENGEIAFPGVAEGAYVLCVHMDGWEFRCRRIEVKGKEPMHVPLALGSYRVRIKVVDARGEPVTKAKCWLSEGGSLGARSRDPEASPTGYYTVPCLREGRYVPHVVAGGVSAKGAAIEVGPGSPHPEITLPLPQTGSLTVRVVDRDGEPVRDVAVEVEHSSGSPCLAFESDRNGEVRIDHLAVGKWCVRRKGDEIARSFDVKPLAEAKVALPPVARGTLVVSIFGSSGQAVSGEFVRVTHSSGKPFYDLVTDENGSARLELPVGKWMITSRFTAKHSAEVTASTEVSVRMAYPY